MIEPDQADETLLADIAATDPVRGTAVWWLGQSGFLLKTTAGTVLLDPYLSDSLTVKYRETDRPHERLTARCVAPERVTGLDLLTSSHNHTDHLDAATLNPLRAANPAARLVIPEANRAFVAERLGCPLDWPVGLDAGEQVTVGGFTIHGVAAAHETIERDGVGRCRYLGYVVTWPGGAVYHSGDTLWHDGLVAAVAPFAVDLALLPINGRRPERRVAGNLFGDEAAWLARAIGARMVVPCHFGMFAFNTESPELFESTCRQIGQPYRTLRCGEKLILSR